MNTLLTYGEFGVRHLIGWGAADHILFLLALAAPYRLRQWRALLAVASAFTVGHSITLALAVTHLVTLPTALIEFLIPVTIAVTAGRNLFARAANPGREAVLAGLFGLIHGAGFANYLAALFDGPIATPLLGFNLGIEVGQVAIITAFLVGAEALAWLGSAGGMSRWPARRLVISAGAAVGGVLLAVNRLPELVR